jgi:FMN-dependent NADH-azoreductase
VLGLPLYNYGAPSSVKAWVDHLIAPGPSFDPVTGTGLLGDRDFVVLATRGGGYGAGAPREGWDHAEPWLPHGVSLTGLEPRFIAAELTLAAVRPAMADLIPLAEASLAEAEKAIDGLWSPELALAGQ